MNQRSKYKSFKINYKNIGKDGRRLRLMAEIKQSKENWKWFGTYFLHKHTCELQAGTHTGVPQKDSAHNNFI